MEKRVVIKVGDKYLRRIDSDWLNVILDSREKAVDLGMVVANIALRELLERGYDAVLEEVVKK